jgi:ribokinase
MTETIVVLGSFVADTAYRASRLPAWGETLMGSGFALGPGGKGSNQAVAAARALGSSGKVQMISKLGDDAISGRPTGLMRRWLVRARRLPERL